MSSTRKKQIPALQKKKVTASARSWVSTSTVRKATKSHLDESFLQSSPPSDVITESYHPSLTTPPNQPPMGNQSDVMIDMLRQLTQSNQSILEESKRLSNRQQILTIPLQGSTYQIPTPGLPGCVPGTTEFFSSSYFSAFV